MKSTDSAQSATTYAYDTAKEPRGLTTSRTDSVAGTFAATYNADGGLTTESLPGGYTLNATRNEVGAQTSRVYTRDSDSTIVASDTVDRSVHGETAADTDSNGQTRSRSYGYDPLGRLIRADETNPDGSCTRRDYSLDDNSNRTALAASTGDVGAECTSTGAVTTAYTYDSADRLTNSGTVYDAFGRTTTQSSGATIAYYADDMVRQQTAGNSRQTWTLDAVGRLAAWTTQDKNSDGTWTQTGSRTNHYAADGDGPSWTAEDANGTITRNVQGLDNGLEATTGKTGATALQLTDIHGDITVQVPLATTGAPTALAYDEYGNLQGESPSTR